MHRESLSEEVKGKARSEYLRIDWKIIFEWILNRYNGKLWTGVVWLKIRTIVSLL
jgi:hypothetical protein